MNRVRFDVKDINVEIKENPQFGDERIKVTNQCLYKDGKPWLPCSGEMHYSRVPEEDWDKTLKMMKDGGVSVVSTYVFWIHHEEIKGNFSFEGRLNIRKFIKKCDEHGLFVFLRPGPWPHGECRNGGFPDWLVEECLEACKDMDREWEHTDCDIDVGTRCLVEPYMTYVTKYMQTVMNEVKDLKNIIGIQIENELSKSPDYLTELKRIVEETGIKVPIYTATGWGNAKIGNDLIPTWGGYPDAGWEQSMDDMVDQGSYIFRKGPFYNAEIGTDILDEALQEGENIQTKTYDVPFFTCELGGGIESTYKRRLDIVPEDISAISLCALGSGVVWLGVFMYRGGYNPIGVNTTFQECKATGYPNEYPVVSYDFHTPIGEVGQIKRHYYLLKNIFEFCNHFGNIIAPMIPELPGGVVSMDVKDKTSLRCSVRSDGECGFLFVNNHNHIQQLSQKDDVVFTIQTRKNTVEIPIKTILPGCHFVMPFNFVYEDLKAQYITAFPVKKGDNLLVFTKIRGIEPVLCRESGEIIKLKEKQTIDGVDIIVKEEVEYRVSQGNLINSELLEENEQTFKYFEHLGIEDMTKEYKVKFSEKAKYLKINWMGNVAMVFNENNLVCDRYFDGNPWIIDAGKLEKKEIIIKVQPFTKYDIETIYTNYACERMEGHFAPTVEELFDDVVYV